MQRSSSKKEILNYYDFRTDTPTHSALIQQRNKLKPSAFEDLFYRFTNAVTPDLKYNVKVPGTITVFYSKNTPTEH